MRTSRNANRFWTAICCACALSVGCGYSWTASNPMPYEPDEIWKTAYRTVAEEYDIIYASSEDRELETDWKSKMDPRYLKSFRNKVYLKVEEFDARIEEEQEEPFLYPAPVPAEPKKFYVVKIQVYLQQNRSIDEPASRQQATWFPIGANPGEERRILDMIDARFRLRHPKSLEEYEPDEEPDAS